MPSRRRLLSLLLAGFVPLDAVAAPAAPAEAAAFIRRAGGDLAAIVDAPGPAASRRHRLARFIERVVAVPDVARFCLGRFWRRASPAQQAEYLRLFHDILLDNILAHIGEQSQARPGGMSVTIGRTLPDGKEIDVPTAVRRASGPEFMVVWVVRITPDGPRIVDLRALGTSLRITVRDDIAAFLTRHGDSIPALLVAMRRQIRTAQTAAAQ